MRPEVRALFGDASAAHDVEAFDRDPARFLRYLDASGVDRAVLVNYVAPEVIGYTTAANDFVAEYARADPERLVAVGGVLPSHPDPGAEVEWLVRSRGIRGIK